MINPTIATIVVIMFVIIFGIIIPYLDVKVKDYMSLRWAALVVLMACGVGAILDFSHLSEECRYLIILAMVIGIGVWMILRTIEKLLMKGWVSKINVKKGDAELTVIPRGEEKDAISKRNNNT